MNKADRSAHELRLLRQAVIRMGVENGWWRTTSDTTQRLAARIFPRTAESASALTDFAVARRVFDSAAPGVRHHLFSLPPHVETAVYLASRDPSSPQETESKTISEIASSTGTPATGSSPVGVHFAGSLEDLLSGRLTTKIARTFAAWQPGQPIPIPYFTSDDE